MHFTMSDNSCEPVGPSDREGDGEYSTESSRHELETDEFPDEAPLPAQVFQKFLQPQPPVPPPPLLFTARIAPDGSVGSVQRRLSQKELRLRMVQAIEKHDLATVQHLVTEGIDLNCIILFNKTPLTYAIELCYFDIAEVLVMAGADINAREPLASARQPLHVAIERPLSLDMFEFLFDHGADINGWDGCGSTALMLASVHGLLPVVRMLLTHGANVQAVDNVRRTALHRAAEGQHENVVRLLINSGADINAQDKFGWTALYHSIVFGHVGMIRTLLDCGISVSTLDCNKRSPLVIACNRLCPLNLKVVLSTSMDFHKRERRIPTPALHAVLSREDCTQCDFIIMDALINAGAQLNVPQLSDFLVFSSNLLQQSKEMLLHYLVLCGCIGQQDDWAMACATGTATLTHLQRWIEEQQSLQSLCRVAVRRHLAARCGCRDIFAAINSLPVPVAMKNWLNIVDFNELYPSFIPKFPSSRPLSHDCASKGWNSSVGH